MKARIRRWGNTLALRIPQALAAEVGFAPGTPVDLTVEDGKLVIAPIVAPVATLEQLLADITDENVHGEVAWGRAVAKEAWP